MLKLPHGAIEFLHSLSDLDEQQEKIITGLQGVFQYYPFTRLSLFTYSPINYVCESFLFLHANGDYFATNRIREDVRDLPLFHNALKNKRAVYAVLHENKNLLPVKYIDKYDLSSMLVVPLWTGSRVIGWILLDRYKGEQPITDSLIFSIEEYFRQTVNVIVSSESENYVKLSRREVEVLELLSHGWSTKEMAHIMGISEFTARDYISSAMKKLHVRNRAQAIAESMRTGIIS